MFGSIGEAIGRAAEAVGRAFSGAFGGSSSSSRSRRDDRSESAAEPTVTREESPSDDLDAFGGPGPDVGNSSASVGLDAFGGPGPDVGNSSVSVGLDAFGGPGPDVGSSSASVGLDAFGGPGPEVSSRSTSTVSERDDSRSADVGASTRGDTGPGEDRGSESSEASIFGGIGKALSRVVESVGRAVSGDTSERNLHEEHALVDGGDLEAFGGPGRDIEVSSVKEEQLPGLFGGVTTGSQSRLASRQAESEPGSGRNYFEDIVFGAGGEVDPRFEALPPGEKAAIGILQRMGASTVANGIVLGVADNVSNAVSQVVPPGPARVLTDLGSKVMIARVVGPTAEGVVDAVSDYRGTPQESRTPGIINPENWTTDVVPSATSIVVGQNVGKAVGAGLKALSVVPTPLGAALKLGTAIASSSIAFQATGKVQDLFLDWLEERREEGIAKMAEGQNQALMEDVAKGKYADATLQRTEADPEGIRQYLRRVEEKEVPTNEDPDVAVLGNFNDAIAEDETETVAEARQKAASGETAQSGVEHAQSEEKQAEVFVTPKGDIGFSDLALEEAFNDYFGASREEAPAQIGKTELPAGQEAHAGKHGMSDKDQSDEVVVSEAEIEEAFNNYYGASRREVPTEVGPQGRSFDGSPFGGNQVDGFIFVERDGAKNKGIDHQDRSGSDDQVPLLCKQMGEECLPDCCMGDNGFLL